MKNPSFKRAVVSFIRLAGHPSRRWFIVLEAFLTLVTSKLMLSLLPFRRYRTQLQSQNVTRDALEQEQLAEIVWAVDRLSKLFPKQLNCMPRAITVQRMLRRRGCGGLMLFGVRKSEDGSLVAHAWLEVEGQVVIGALPNLDEYARLPSWPEAKS